MHLERLKLANFRAFRSAELVLPAEGLVVVAGANNVGKSALLSVFGIVAGRDGSSPVRFHGTTEPASIRATFRLTYDERRHLAGEGPYVQDWLDTPILSSMTLGFADLGDGHGMYVSEMETEDLDGEPWVFSKLAGPARTASWSEIAQAIQSPLTGATMLRSAGLTSQVTGASPSHLRDNAPGASRFVTLLKAWSEALYHFSAIRTGTPRRSPIGTVSPQLAPSGQNLAQCLLYQFSQRSPIWERVCAVMGDVLPDAGDLVVPAAGTDLEVAFVDPVSGERRNLKDLGSGVEQLLMTAYVGEVQAPGSVTLIEEPETSLHPYAQRELLRHIERLSDNRLIVATTHSSVVLDGRSAQSTGSTWLVRRLAGTSELVEVSADLAPAITELGVRLSDVLSAERILLVEGETDAEILRVWFGSQLTKAGAVVVPMGGGDRAFHLDSVQRVLAGSDRLQRRFLFIRDRDELSGPSLSELQDFGVAVLARRELENYFLDQPAAISAVLASRASASVDLASLEGTIRSAADELRDLVIFKRVVKSLPTRLFSRRDINELVRDGDATKDGLREKLAAMGGRLASAAEAFDEIWNREASSVNQAWTEHWLELAPGTEALSRVWDAAGLHYDKARDGGSLAQAMPSGPNEIHAILDSFLR